jgi:hypothetical protein
MPQGNYYRDHWTWSIPDSKMAGPSWLRHQTFHLPTHRLLPLLPLLRPQLLQAIVPNLVGPHGWLDKAECIERAQVERCGASPQATQEQTIVSTIGAAIFLERCTNF